jgi:hypothetical protein
MLDTCSHQTITWPDVSPEVLLIQHVLSHLDLIDLDGSSSVMGWSRQFIDAVFKRVNELDIEGFECSLRLLHALLATEDELQQQRV